MLSTNQMMPRNNIIATILLVALSSYAHAKPIPYTTQQLINRAAKNSDTIFVGKVLGQKEIENGFSFNGNNLSIGILTVEVLKAYRGNLKQSDHKLVCTWIDKIEHKFNYPIGREFVFFGVDMKLNIQLPSTYGFIFAPDKIHKELYKALALRYKPIKNTKIVFEIVEPNDYVSRNVCNEPDALQAR